MVELRRFVSARLWLLVAAVLSTALPQSAAGAGWRRPELDALRQQAAAAGEVRVMVEVAAGAGKGIGELLAARDDAGARHLGKRIARIQDRVLDELGREGRLLRRYETIPWLAVAVGPEGLERLARMRDVRRVVEDRLRRPHLTESVPLIGAAAAHAAGFDGRGTAVAILDSGVDAGHPFYGGRVREESCFSANGDCPDGSGRQVGAGAAAPCLQPADGCEHGTHVAGIAAGSGGVAPAADILAANVFSVFEGEDCGEEGGTCVLSYDSDQVAALEWVFGKRSAYRIAAVNMSLGGGQYFDEVSCDADDPAKKAMIDNLRGVGIATVISSGNSGFTDSLGSPGCISSAVAVGSTTKSDEISSFSNSSSFLELLAPGSAITSSYPGGQFERLSGTSMAAPHVTGAWSLLVQAQPSASVPAVLGALQASGVPITDARNGITKSRIQVDDAINLLAGGGTGECREDATTLCLLDGRFRVKVTWRNQFNGQSGAGGSLPSTDFTGFFYFTDPSNVELIVKILDFGDVVKVFYGQLTNLQFTITVTDTDNGLTKTYTNSPGDCGAIDQNGFPSIQAGVLLEKDLAAPLANGHCRVSVEGLCLLGNRFRVDVSWRNPYNGLSGEGTAHTLSNLSGYFTYVDPENVELLVKALDFGDRVLFLYGALSDFEYQLRVTDTLSGDVKTYLNPARTYCGGIDNDAFGGGSGSVATVSERENNDTFNAAQALPGGGGVEVSGNVEVSDRGSFVITYSDGTRDDVEDLYRVRLVSGGVVASLSGLSADADLFLINATGTAVIERSNRAGTAGESIDLPDIGPGTYYLGVSIYDPNPIRSATSYKLFVNGGL